MPQAKPASATSCTQSAISTITAWDTTCGAASSTRNSPIVPSSSPAPVRPQPSSRKGDPAHVPTSQNAVPSANSSAVGA